MLQAAYSFCNVARARHARLIGASQSVAVRLQASSTLARHVQALVPRRRGALVGRAAEVAQAYADASSLGTTKLKDALDFRQLCAFCRLLTAGGHAPNLQWLQAAATELEERLAAGGGLSREDADAAAELTLAACEANHGQELGTSLVKALRSAGMASTSSGKSSSEGLSGAGAASLALAGAATGLADTTLLDALIGRCSALEEDLDLAALGDIRLATMLAGPSLTADLDVRAAGFLRTLCNDALLDDPRGRPETGDESLTPLEIEVSETLHACETPHSRGAMLCGAFFPLMSHARGAIICAEHVAAYATYANAPDERTAWQRWKYKAVIVSGMRVFAVPEVAWKALSGEEERAAFMRQVLQQPIDAGVL